MKKTLLLCFIHGFKGSDNTFGDFPNHLRAILTHTLPNVIITTITYPKYDTRGDLHDCVTNFKEWLQNKIFDLEVANGAVSPTINPTVHTILIGHSMGGIVAAEALLSIISEQPIPPVSSLDANSNTTATTNTTSSADPNSPSRSKSFSIPPKNSLFLFPYIAGILAFDTPYLGLHPGVVAHGAEGHWQTASAAYNTYNELSNAFGWASPKRGTSPNPQPKALPAPESGGGGGWGKWGKYAMYAGAAGVVASGLGAVAYSKHEQLSEGFQWMNSHLEFVGCLARGEELKNRVASIIKISQTHDIGFADLYTCLGAAVDGKSKWSSGVLGSERTFCSLPKSETSKGYFHPSRNDKAVSETWAHMSMFNPQENPGYYGMSEEAKSLIAEWVSSEWYDEAEKGGAKIQTEDNPDVKDASEAKAKTKSRKEEPKAPDRSPDPSDVELPVPPVDEFNAQFKSTSKTTPKEGSVEPLDTLQVPEVGDKHDRSGTQTPASEGKGRPRKLRMNPKNQERATPEVSQGVKEDLEKNPWKEDEEMVD